VLRIASIFVLVVFVSSIGWSQPQIQAVVNSASFQPGVQVPTITGVQAIQSMPSGGALATAFVSGLTAIIPGTYVASSSSPLPFALGGLAVLVNGAPAPILSVFVPDLGSSDYTQVNFQVPMERNAVFQGAANCPYCAGPTTVDINGATFTVPAGVRGMGAFFSGADGYAIARHAFDSSLITAQSPAHGGETVIVYADDFFDVWPSPPMGLPVPPQPSFTFNLPLYARMSFAVAPNGTAGLGSVGLYLQDYPGPGVFPPPLPGPYGSFTDTPALQITYEGLAVGLIGVEEIHFVVPQNQAPGDWALFFNSGTCTNGKFPCITAGAGVSSAYVKLPVR
jgi:uncharacterized protein (TIGR03437 family)